MQFLQFTNKNLRKKEEKLFPAMNQKAIFPSENLHYGLCLFRWRRPEKGDFDEGDSASQQSQPGENVNRTADSNKTVVKLQQQPFECENEWKMGE